MWQSFHENLKHSGAEDYGRVKQVAPKAPVSAFTFDKHQALQLIPGLVINEQSEARSATVKSNYEPIMWDLRKDIADASLSRRQGGVGWTTARGSDSGYHQQDLFSPIKSSAPYVEAGIASKHDSLYSPIKSAPLTDAEFMVKPMKLLAKASIFNERPAFPAPATRQRSFPIAEAVKVEPEPVQKVAPKRELVIRRSEPTPANSSDECDSPDFDRAPRSMTPDNGTPVQASPNTPEVDEETAAERIISSVVNATPSPVKPLTLTERTRMSMAYFNAEPSLEEPDSIESGIVMPSQDDSPEANFEIDRRATLLERTRLSMAQVPLKSRKSIKHERRTSLFPVNQFETPGKPRAVPNIKRNATPTEKLFEQDIDYASVFKSRPRIALSPVVSPDEKSFEGMDEMVDGEETGEWGSSPLRGRNVVGGVE